MVRRGWFRRTAIRLFRETYGDENRGMFVFSMGWFLRFQQGRALTKKASRLPAEYERLVIHFLRFNRCQSMAAHAAGIPIPPSHVLNLDETPIPFEYLDGKTYDIKGTKTVSAKTDRSGWDKQQTTLIFYIFGDGVARIPPKIIFHGAPGNSGRIFDREGQRYNSGITVEFNSTAYNNEELFLKFIDQELAPSLDRGPPKELSTNDPSPYTTPRNLVLLDVFARHVTSDVLAKLRSYNILPSIIPGGCTGLVQPTDTSVNKPFKAYLRKHTDTYIERKERASTKPYKDWSISEKVIPDSPYLNPHFFIYLFLHPARCSLFSTPPHPFPLFTSPREALLLPTYPQNVTG